MRSEQPLYRAALWGAAVIGFIGYHVRDNIGPALASFRGPVIPDARVTAFWVANGVSLAWAGAFFFALLGVGERVSRWLGRAGFPLVRSTRRFPGVLVLPRKASRLAEYLPIAVLLGFGGYACGVVALGLCGLFFAPVAKVLVLVAAAAGFRTLRSLRRHASPLPLYRPGVFGIAALLIGSLSAVFCLTPETWDDSLGYHLTAPQDFNKLHKWVDIHQDMYRFPLLAEGVFGQGLLVDGEQTATLINLTGAVLLGWLLWGWASRLAGPPAGWLALLCLVASEAVGFHLGQTNQGFYSMGFAFAAVWAWCGSLSAAHPAKWSLLAGAMLGGATCSKYTAIVPGFGMVAWHLLKSRIRPGRELRSLGSLAIGFAAASIPFLANGWLFTGNPVYPLVWGGLHWDDRNTRVLHEFGCPGTDFQLSNPGSVLAALGRLLAIQQPLFLLALPAALTTALPNRSAFMGIWLSSFAVWSVTIPCLRLMLPGFPALSLLCGIGLSRWLTDRRSHVQWLGTGTILTAALAGGIHAVALADFHKKSFMAAVGLEPAEHFYRRVLTSYWRTTVAVNLAVAPDERILALGERRGYLFTPLVYNRDVEDSPAMLDIVHASRSPEHVHRKLRQRGVEYLLLNYVTSEYLTRYRWREFAWRPDEIRRHWEFCRRYLSVEWMDPAPDGINGGYVLYRIAASQRRPPRLLPFLPGAESAGVRHPGDSDVSYERRLSVLEQFAPGVVYFDARHASVLLNGGFPDRALLYSSRGIGSSYPEQAVLLGLRGAALHRLGRLQEAIDAFRQAEMLKPEEPSFREYREAIRRGSAE